MVDVKTSSSELFPEAPRVIYDRSPLEEVVCQLRFPTILRIEGEVPASFQELVRDRFPLFERPTPQIEGNLPPEILQVIGASVGQSLNYSFMTEDRQRTVTLTPDFLALTFRNYSKWEDFTEALTQVVEALHTVYSPSFYTRIGLRYRNSIRPDQVGANGQPWARLLSPHIAGDFADAADAHDYLVVEAKRHLRLLSSDSKIGVLLQHGLGAPTPTSSYPYIIDTDVYTDQRTEVTDALSVLKKFNRIAGGVFRWCISDELHSLLGPHPVGADSQR